MKRIRLIDLVRSFSILVVMAVHEDESAAIHKPVNSFCFWVWEHFERNGTYGVYSFFVVSGFLIAGVVAKNPGGLWKPSLQEFYVQRMGRIFPLLSLTLWIGILMLMIPRSFNDSNLDVFHPDKGFLGPGFWICILTFTFNWFRVFNPLINYGLHFGVLWSLSIEEQFYLLFPQALKKLGNVQNLCRFLFFVVVFGFLWRLGAYYFQSNRYMQICGSPGAFDNIAVGILLFLAVGRWESFLLENKKISRLLCIAGFGMVLGIYLGTSQDVASDRVYASTVLDLGLFIFLLGGLHLSLFESKFWKPLSWPGKYCYGGYLLHPMVLAVLFPVFFRKDAWSAFGLFVIVTVALSAISYHFFELPANRLVRKTFIKITPKVVV